MIYRAVNKDGIPIKCHLREFLFPYKSWFVIHSRPTGGGEGIYMAKKWQQVQPDEAIF